MVAGEDCWRNLRVRFCWEDNCGVGACARGVTFLTVTAVIRAIILSLITVNCLVMLLISKSALTASLTLSSRAQRWVIQSRKQNLIRIFSCQVECANKSYILWPSRHNIYPWDLAACLTESSAARLVKGPVTSSGLSVSPVSTHHSVESKYMSK